MSFDTIVEDSDKTHVASQDKVQATQAHRLGEILRVDETRAQEASRQQTLIDQQVSEAAQLTKCIQVIGRIQKLLTSSNGRAVIRSMKSEQDKLRQTQ